jgi:hypothetical protein
MNTSNIDRATAMPDYSDPLAVYTFYGIAAWWAQLFELMMLDLVAAIRLADGDQIDDIAYQTAFENLDRQTLGMLLRKCREAQRVMIPEDDERVLGEALEKRNYLIHRFFSVHDDELLDDAKTLVDELRELSALLAAGRQAAEGLYFAILKAVDVDHTMTERILRLGTAWDNVIMRGKS